MSEPEPILESLYIAIRSSDDTWFFSGSLVVPAELVTPEVNNLGMFRWSPVRFRTSSAVLATLYDAVPGPLPRLFKRLLLSYRWLRVGIPEVTLFGNPPGPGLFGFKQEIMRDRYLYPILFSQRLVEFGKAPGGSYDPICFDLKRTEGGDCPIVRIDHESVLVEGRGAVVCEVAESFSVLAERIAKGGSQSAP